MSRKKERIVRKTLADGTVREYRYGGADKPAAPPAPRYEAGTLAEMLLAYQNSAQYRELSHKTHACKAISLRYLTPLHATPADQITRAMLADIGDAINVKSGPGAATAFIKDVSAVYNWAIERGKFDRANPAFRLPTYAIKRLPAFTLADCERAERELAEPMRRVLVLGRWTAQRRGDLIGLTWSAYDGETLRFTQQKNRTRAGKEPVQMVLHVHPELKAELDAWKAEAAASNVVSLADRRDGIDPLAGQTILVNFDGQPWKPVAISQRMKANLERIGIREKGEKGVGVHGLRKMTAAMLAESGASVKEIQGVTGHRTLGMIQLYTESADRERLGRQAIMKLSKQK